MGGVCPPAAQLAPGGDTWDVEYATRQSIMKGLEQPGKEARDGDILISGDVDEWAKASTATFLRRCTGCVCLSIKALKQALHQKPGAHADGARHANPEPNVNASAGSKTPIQQP
jgi:hypothetical protein